MQGENVRMRRERMGREEERGWVGRRGKWSGDKKEEIEVGKEREKGERRKKILK